jgi:WS/DGAT/MGAT family acyltransferase
MTTVHPVERVSTDDLMSLASESGSTPMQVGAVLMLDTPAGLDPGSVLEALACRVRAVPRLRQRLIRVPPGCGRPVWADDPGFAADSHFSTVRCPAPGGQEAILEVAAEMLVTRLPRDRPLWKARLVTDCGQGEAALILVFHHVLADGMGGLAVLASLVDGAAVPESPESRYPRPMPSRRRLATDAAREAVRGFGQVPTALRRLRSALSQLRPVAGMTPARCSLNVPTGQRRKFATVRVDLEQTLRAAHAHQATVNDVVLSAIAAALHRLLAARGEQVDEFVISVPFSARHEAGAGDLGNQSGVIPLRVSGVGDPARRLELVAEHTRAAKLTQAGASTALLGPFFRLLARSGLYQWFISHQRLIHTFVTNLRGPQARLSFLGNPITALIPLTVATGNVTLSFAVLSYANSLTITLIADGDACADLSRLREFLTEELAGYLNGSAG